MVRTPALTADLVARVHRVVAENNVPPGFRPLRDADYDSLCDRLCTQVPDSGFWIFAYGSLIWKPGFDHIDASVAHVHGWRRAFCLHLDNWRATPDNPGLMLALAPGGSCRGVAYRMPPDDRRGRMMRLLRREMDYHEEAALTRWCTARLADGTVQKVLTFYCMGPRAAGLLHLPIDRQVDRLVSAAGRAGSAAEYLHNTLMGLEAAGVHDSYLWRLQAAVAARIRADHGLNG